jgi:hypothetical protein
MIDKSVRDGDPRHVLAYSKRNFFT